jgi:hypothetical protein
MRLPFGLTPSEYTALKIAFEAGCFIPGSCSCRRPSKPLLKEIAMGAGKAPDTFSHQLNNACRKLIISLIYDRFVSWVDNFEFKNGIVKQDNTAQLTLEKWGGE